MNENIILEIITNAKEKMDAEAKILEANLENLKKQGNEGGFLNKGKTRKSKNNPEHERNFICGCGKTYLSYPALYTHIKNKHNGKAPDGTLLESQTKARRLKQSMNNLSQISKEGESIYFNDDKKNQNFD